MIWQKHPENLSLHLSLPSVQVWPHVVSMCSTWLNSRRRCCCATITVSRTQLCNCDTLKGFTLRSQRSRDPGTVQMTVACGCRDQTCDRQQTSCWRSCYCCSAVLARTCSSFVTGGESVVYVYERHLMCEWKPFRLDHSDKVPDVSL